MIDNRIETFLTLCSVMNYRKAAERLNLTQPAVTQHIHYFERLYGCKLFVYDRRSLKMTPQAQLLRQYAENIVYQEKKLRAKLREDGGCSLSIGATKTIGEYVIADHIAAYLAEPGNRIEVKVDNTEQLLHILQNGELDFALIEGSFRRDQFASQLYRTEPFVGLCGSGHPFAGKTVPLGALWAEHILLREEGSGTRSIFEQLLAERSHSVAEFSRITTISNFSLMRALLARGDTITFAYRAVRGSDPALAEFSVAGWDIRREFNYVYLDTPVSEQGVEYFESFRARTGVNACAAEKRLL